MLLDACLLEVFVGEGEGTLSDPLFPQPESCGLQVFAEGGAATLGELRVWPMAATDIG